MSHCFTGGEIALLLVCLSFSSWHARRHVCVSPFAHTGDPEASTCSSPAHEKLSSFEHTSNNNLTTINTDQSESISSSCEGMFVYLKKYRICTGFFPPFSYHNGSTGTIFRNSARKRAHSATLVESRGLKNFRKRQSGNRTNLVLWHIRDLDSRCLHEVTGSKLYFL